MYHYQFNIGDYRKDTSHLSLLEHGIYRMLIDSYYACEGILEADDAKIMRSHCIRTSDEEAAYRNVIADFFTLDDGLYRHSGCDKVMERIYGKSAKAKESAKARWDKRNATKMRNACGDDANAQYMDANALELNAIDMLPVTRNPEPVTQDKPTDTCVSVIGAKASPPCPHLEIIAAYNRILPELQAVIPERWAGARADALKSRWRESPKHQRVEFWERFFSELRRWPFYMGENDRAWKADLGWIVKRTNFDKLIEKFTSKRAG